MSSAVDSSKTQRQTAVSGGSATSKFTDIVVAIHGIGDQSRFATVRSVTVRFADSESVTADAEQRPVAPQPLGYFHSNGRKSGVLDDLSKLAPSAAANIGFAEVYWAHIPRDVSTGGFTLEETKEWARTVVARAHSRYLEAQRAGDDTLVRTDFSLAGEVLDEVIDTVHVLENLTFLAEKAGVFTFDLAPVLENYLGDVQLVAEFSDHRATILAEFFKKMEEVYQEQCDEGNPDVRLHIVAHSEGTVVSFLGLLLAMSGLGPDEKPERKAPAWLKQMRGYMTIGSPIDKHLLLWPRLWRKLTPEKSNPLFAAEKIKWRNYYDLGDPVGFKLDTARDWIADRGLTAFEFQAKHDMGFARYPFPGKAHNDYWDDEVVFEHFIKDVVRNEPPPPPPPDKKLVARISPMMPHVLAFVILLVGVFVMYKAVTNYMNPEGTPLEQYQLLKNGESVGGAVSGIELVRNVLGVSFLVAGVTLFARFPRLAAGGLWRGWAIGAFLIGCAFYSGVVSPDSRHAIGAVFDNALLRDRSLGYASLWPTIGVCLLALLVACIGRFANHERKDKRDDRRQRLFWRGMRPLIACGAVGVTVLVLGQAYIRSKATVADGALYPLMRADQKLWPVVLATLAFLYLWWLATLIFDLGFVWNRYVRGEMANTRLIQWDRAARKHKQRPAAGATTS